MWIAMTIVGLIVLGAIKDDHLSAGNPYRLTNTIDYAGNICGVDKGFKDLGKGYYLPDSTGAPAIPHLASFATLLTHSLLPLLHRSCVRGGLPRGLRLRGVFLPVP